MTDDYVSFETAKLLKEAGFIVFCDKYFVKPEITDYYKGRGINANWNALDEYFFPSHPLPCREVAEGKIQCPF